MTKASIENRISVFLDRLENGFSESVPSIARLARQEKRNFLDGKLAERYFVSDAVETLLKDVEELSQLQF